MTTQTFLLPDLGEGLTEALLVRWAVSVGDEIALDQVIAEVETAKSIVDLPSPYAGTVLALHGEEGATILTGAPVIEVGSGSAASAATPATAPEHEAYRAEEQAGSGNVLIGYGTGAGLAKGRRRRPAQRSGGAPSASAEADVAGAADTAGALTDPARGPVAVRSPIVRRLARELGIDVRRITATGCDGAVTRADVLHAAQTAQPVQPAEPAVLRAAQDEHPIGLGPQHPGPVAGPLSEIRREKFSPLRKAVSATLSRSRAEIPEATVWVDVDVTELWRLRPVMAQPGEKAPSVTALFARYVLLALERYPLMAARIEGGDEIVLFDGVNLGVAVDTERGLLVPMIQRADALPVAGLDAALRELAATARDGRTPPKLLQGSTFTINNYGGLGVDGSAAIINTPNVAILGIGRIMERAWVFDGQIVPRRIAQLSLVFDHRVCDGGYAAGFLRAVVDMLEHPLAVYPRL